MTTHRIESGETLGQLAQRYGTTVAALAKANGISNPNLIIAGQSLKIVSKKPSSSFSSGGSRGSGGAGDSSGLYATGGVSAPNGITGAARLAQNAYHVALSMGGYTSGGLCATGVSRAIAETYGIHVSGNGNQIDNNLPRSKFKQVNISLAQALKIPGCILTWEKTSTAAGSIYGHTAITAGDGHTSYSDFIERNTLAGAQSRSGLKIFVPI